MFSYHRSADGRSGLGQRLLETIEFPSGRRLLLVQPSHASSMASGKYDHAQHVEFVGVTLTLVQLPMPHSWHQGGRTMHGMTMLISVSGWCRSQCPMPCIWHQGNHDLAPQAKLTDHGGSLEAGGSPVASLSRCCMRYDMYTPTRPRTACPCPVGHRHDAIPQCSLRDGSVEASRSCSACLYGGCTWRFLSPYGLVAAESAPCSARRLSTHLSDVGAPRWSRAQDQQRSRDTLKSRLRLGARACQLAATGWCSLPHSL